MKRIAMIAVVALCVSTAKAAELNTVSAGDVAAIKMDIPVSAPRLIGGAVDRGYATGEITRLHLLAQTGKSLLFTSASTEAEFKEFVEMWTPILGKFGIKVTATAYKDGFGTLTYSSTDGRVVRDFLAENLTYNALDPAAVNTLKNGLLAPLKQSGMTPIAVLDIKNELVRPTFKLYYLTKPEENADHEVRLRQFKTDGDIDFDVLAGSVNIVKKDAASSLVYIGKLLGLHSTVAADEAAAAVKLADYKKFLAANKLEFATSKTFKLNSPLVVEGATCNYGLNMYFFQ